jgi:hypothetical protein
MFVITLRLKFKKTEIRKIIFRCKWWYIKGAKSPKKITPDRGTKITKVVDYLDENSNKKMDFMIVRNTPFNKN